MTPTADYIGRPATDIAALNSLRLVPNDAACPNCGRSIDQHPDTGVYSCSVCGWVEGQRQGQVRVTCVDCGISFACDHDDVWGFDDADPIYMCGTCQRRRRFDYGA